MDNDEDGELSSRLNFDHNGELISNQQLESRDTLTLPTSPASRRRHQRRSNAVSLQGGSETLSILELLQQIVREPAPKLTSSEKDEGKFPKAADEFIDACLIKEQQDRRPPVALLKFEWIENTITSVVDMIEWAELI